jgi:hypothetical protein
VRFFQKVKEIRSKEGELHFQRFALIETSRFSIYIHKIFKADQDLHLHSHPWNFKSIILRGSYIEESLAVDEKGKTRSEFNTKKPFTASSMTKFGEKDYFVNKCFHKIKCILKGPVYSLFFAYGKKERWNYFVNGYIWDFEYYRQFKNETGFWDNGRPKNEPEKPLPVGFDEDEDDIQEYVRKMLMESYGIE